jgi:hypothetical protein
MAAWVLSALVWQTHLRAAPPADADNAATLYRQAFATVPDSSDPEFSFLNEPDGVVLDDNAANYLKQHDDTFDKLRRAAAMPKCDWGTDVRLASRAKLPHLNSARGMSQLARLRVRWLFQQGRHAEALDDAAALLALSRRIGDEPFVVSKLTEAGVAESAVHAAAAGLAAVPPDLARKFAEAVGATHRSMPAAEVVWKEGASTVEELRALAAKDQGGLFAEGAFFWSATDGPPDAAARREAVRKQWDDPAARDAGIGEVASLYDEVARHLALPFDQSLAPVQRWETKREKASPLARLMVPPMKTYRAAVAAAGTRVEMLRVAALVRADGPAAAADAREPHTDGTFKYREIPGGFEIESRMVVNGQALKVTCRAPRDALPF